MLASLGQLSQVAWMWEAEGEKEDFLDVDFGNDFLV
jgi:hypothetical protein